MAYSDKKPFTEEMILDPGFRATVLKEIDSPENVFRKNQAYKAYECFKDLTGAYVIESLLKQFEKETVAEMEPLITNISFTRKIVDKLARVYNYGVKRWLPSKRDTKLLENYLKLLQFNKKMKKTNRYLKLFHNTLLSVLPKKSEEKWYIDLNPIPPFFYDVIEDPNNMELPAVVILSNFSPQASKMSYATESQAGFHNTASYPLYRNYVPYGDGIDQAIADSPEDQKRGDFIWWSKNFHFTTNCNGEIISDRELIVNPIFELPFVNFATDQDGAYWAKGGRDIVDAGININVLLSNINHIGIIQGYGQLYMTGKNLPKSVQAGPTKVIQLEHEEGEPDPKVGFLNASPPMSDLMKSVEMYVALLLSTNNLSTSGFSATLSGANSFASGIAMMIDKSESIEDVDEQASIFLDNEPKILNLVKKWDDLYRKSRALIDEYQESGLPASFKEISILFEQAKPIVSESEELSNIEKRKELGINTMVELIQRDNPGLTEEQANAKLLKIFEEKAKALAAMAISPENESIEGETNGENEVQNENEEEVQETEEEVE